MKCSHPISHLFTWQVRVFLVVWKMYIIIDGNTTLIKIFAIQRTIREGGGVKIDIN